MEDVDVSGPDVTAEYFWLVVFASIVCIGMSWGIGAIDIATYALSFPHFRITL